ncbi:MAG: hypothetical protein WD135_05615 [Ferruginibacter sp.]
MLTKKIKNIVIAICSIVVAVGIYAYTEYNRKSPDLTNVKAIDYITASALINTYSNEEEMANKKYLGRVIQVNGTVVEVINQQDTAFTIVLGDPSFMSRVSCTMDKNHIVSAKKYDIGNVVNVKGICTGYLMDIELNNCLIVE